MPSQRSKNYWIPLFLGIVLGASVTHFLSFSLDSADKEDPTLQTRGTLKNSPSLTGDGALRAGRSSEVSSHSTSEVAGLYALITSTSDQAFSELATQILALPESSPHREAAVDLLFDRWAELNPQAALEFAHTLTGNIRDSAFRATLLRLGQNDFANTLAWLNENLNYSRRDDVQLWLYAGLARKAPQKAIAELEKLPYGKIRDGALMQVAKTWAEDDVMAAFDWFESAPWSNRMGDVYKSLMVEFIRQEPEKAKDLISSMEENYDKRRFQLDLIRSSAEKDAEFAIGIATGIANPQIKGEALINVFESWANVDPASALAQASKLAADSSMDGATENSVFTQAAYAMLWEDSAALRSEFENLPKDVRIEMISPMMKDWMETEPETAIEWVSQFPKDSAEYNLALSGVTHHYMGWNPEEGIRQAQAITFTDVRNDNIYLNLTNLYKQNPDRALTVAADQDLVSPGIQAAFSNWVQEFGEQSQNFYLPEK